MLRGKNSTWVVLDTSQGIISKDIQCSFVSLLVTWHFFQYLIHLIFKTICVVGISFLSYGFQYFVCKDAERLCLV